MAGTELNFNKDNLQTRYPGRYRVYKKLLEGMKSANDIEPVDYDTPEFKLPDGTPDVDKIQKHMALEAEKQMENSAYLFSEFMSSNEAAYELFVQTPAVTKKWTSRYSYEFTPQYIEISITRYLGDDSEVGIAQSLIEDGYSLIAKTNTSIFDLTDSVYEGKCQFDPRRLDATVEAVTFQLVKNYTNGSEVIWEGVASIVEVPYVIDPGDDSDAYLRLEFHNIDDSYIAFGETKHLMCRVYRGWTDVTKDVKAWSITRNTNSTVEDGAWSTKDKVKNFTGSIDICYTSEENDLGYGDKAEFTVTAELYNSTLTKILEI